MKEWLFLSKRSHASVIDNLRTPPYLSIRVPVLPDEITLRLFKKCHISVCLDPSRLARAVKRDDRGARKD